MIRLSLSAEPRWLEPLPGLRILVRPLSTTVMGDAREDPIMEGLTEESPRRELAVRLGKALARAAILEWEGVGDEAGEPLPVTPAAVDALMELFPVFEFWQLHYVQPALTLDAEKNGSGPLPTGTSEGVDPTAAPAASAVPSAPPS